MKTVCQLLVWVAVACAFAACTQEQKVSENQATKPQEIHKIMGVARIEPEKGLLYIYSSANGMATNLLATENQHVHQSQLLVQVSQKADQAQLAVEQTKIKSQKVAISTAKAALQASDTDWEKAKADVVLNQKLLAVNAITEQILNDSQAKAQKLAAEHLRLQSLITEANTKLNEAVASVKYREAVLDEKQVKAAFDGKILQWDIQEGDYLTAGQKLGQFAPDGALVAATEVDELFANRIKVGQKADVFSQANGSKIAEGTVVYVAEFLKKKSLFSDENTVEDRRVKEVKIRLKANANAIVNNRVDCTIYLQ